MPRTYPQTFHQTMVLRSSGFWRPSEPSAERNCSRITMSWSAHSERLTIVPARIPPRITRERSTLFTATSCVGNPTAVSYTHLRAHETPEHLVCRLLLE